MLEYIEISGYYLFLAMGVSAIAGFVKGAVGFGMPMIIITLLSSFLPPNIALAALILPTLVTNVWQALRDGPAQAVTNARPYWRFIAALLVMIMIAAQTVSFLSDRVLFMGIGLPIVAFGLMQLAGFQMPLPAKRRLFDVILGGVAGIIGGISGVWGPLTVAYLTALDTPKKTQFQLLGLIFGSGAVVLLISHMVSGVVTGPTMALSALLLPPALIAMRAGIAVHDRLNQVMFRRATLVVLIVVGLNLIRRGLVG